MWAWGNNADGRLGDGTIYTWRSPVRVGLDNDRAVFASSISLAGIRRADGSVWTHLAIRADGSLWQVGSTNLRIGGDNDWASVSMGHNHFAAIKNDGSLWTWGDNRWGQLGDGRRTTSLVNANRGTPTRVGEDSDWASVSAGDRFVIAIKTDGSLWAWGENRSGKTGLGTARGDTLVPTRIGVGNDWAYVSAGVGHAVAIRRDGSLWAWRDNQHGALGNGAETVFEGWEIIDNGSLIPILVMPQNAPDAE